MIKNKLLFSILVLAAVPSFGDYHLTNPQFKGCSENICYKLSARVADKSNLSVLTYAQDIKLRVFDRKTQKTLKQISGQSGIWIPPQNTWVVSRKTNTHRQEVHFNTLTMVTSTKEVLR